MPYLICYDITKNSLRTKMGKLIIDAGLDRINKSVYLGSISDGALKQLEQALALLVQTKGDGTDSLLLIPVSAAQVQEMRIYGSNDLDKNELTGDKSTLML